jgi:hypothetical protein
LADRGNRLELGLGAVRMEEGLDLLVECGLAGVVEAEEDDRVFWRGCVLAGGGRGGARWRDGIRERVR